MKKNQGRRRGGSRPRGRILEDGNSGARPRGSGERPPQIATTVKSKHRFRFTSGTNVGSFAITRLRLLELLQVAKTATTATRIINAARVRSVELWGEPPALGAAQTSVSVEWVGTNAPSVLHSDTTMGVRPAHVFSVPPAGSSSQWWSITGSGETDQLFIINIGTGSSNVIIDVVVDLRFVDNEAAIATSVNPAAATAGTLYYNYLDGFTSAKLAPIGGTVQV